MEDKNTTKTEAEKRQSSLTLIAHLRTMSARRALNRPRTIEEK